MLFVDEVRDPADLQAMGRGLPERFRLLVTSRRQFGTASQWVPLEPLDEIKAVELLAAVSERGPFSHEPAISEAEAQVAWVEQSQAVMVAVDALW